MSPPLVGPPEIRDPSSLVPNPVRASGPSDPFMDAMVSNFNSTRVNDFSTPPMGYTENNSAAYLSSGNPCLDFFFQVVPSTRKSSIEDLLNKAWDHDALTTLKLICNLRGVRGTGKSDKEGFYKAALWLHGRHPKTLACNLEALSKFGYFKDFPELLYRILLGAEIRKIKKSQKYQNKGKASRARFAFQSSKASYGDRRARGRGHKPGRHGSKKKPEATRKQRIEKAEKRNQEEKVRASLERKKTKASMGKDALIRYSHDPDYRFLHERVSELFADHLKKDMEFLTSGETNKISLAAKWCPSLDSSFDKATLLCESIARKLFPRESFPEYEGVEDSHYAYRVRDRLRKQVLVPLRKTLQLPEVYMGAKDWESLPYNRVASVAMKSYKEIFLNHDAERFQQYLDDVKSGKATVAAGALLPHEIIRSLEDGDGGQVSELQWKRMVDDLKEKGTLKNCMAICDVSASMNGEPIEVAVALGLLVSELSEEPWKGKLITFSQNPAMHLVKGDDLFSKTQFVRNMQWNMNTDFQKVFDLILRVAVERKLKPEDMIKRVFVFSDMEFDQASKRPPSYPNYNGGGRGRGMPHYPIVNGYGMPHYPNSVPSNPSNAWETDYEVIVSKYREKGYGEAVPEIVFWNLRDSRATPVAGNKKGVALVSGFSKNLLKLFLENDGEINPMKAMEDAICRDEYKTLVVVD
ncbi:PREDICTED: uncharacterized protein LOC104705568 [Camelina sativa]|uniref:Uncharacterized protein LOC104705568 n=1 Tax=Camelina sativa TaxID=90675 RepID=A0ABM0T2D3_CAMSA|nr:PREDICTED: uncharacterized protein LOC104705568 [Camelina sativa]